MSEPTAADLISALDGVVWYNGMGEVITKWKVPGVLSNKYDLPHWEEPGYDGRCRDETMQLQVIWMICIMLFGNYGTSPRSGWIENVEGFNAFIDAITQSYREAEEGML